MSIRHKSGHRFGLGVIALTLALGSCAQQEQPPPARVAVAGCTRESDGTMKATSEMHKRVSAVVAEQFGLRPEEVTSDAEFVDDLGADELDAVEVTMALEEEFRIEIPDEDAERYSTVRGAADYLCRRL